MTDAPKATSEQPLDERLRTALSHAGTVLDEADTDYVIEAVMPVLRSFALSEYQRGQEAGDYFARRAVAWRLGLGDIVPPVQKGSSNKASRVDTDG